MGIAGNSRLPRVWNVDLARPMGEWKSAWAAACKEAKICYRWHDLRHTFISRLAENPAVSEGTIKSLAGHVSKRMLERYSHIRMAAKRDAVAAITLRPRVENSGVVPVKVPVPVEPVRIQ